MYSQDQARRRGEIAAGYAKETTDRLLEILERREYPPPMNDYMGDRRIVRELVLIRRSRLTPAQRERLRDPIMGLLVPSAAAMLRRYLAVLGGDEPALLAEWQQEPWNDGSGFEYFDLLDCLSALRSTAPEFLDGLIRRIEERGIYLAYVMLALGRIGPAAGSRAAQAIRQHIREDHTPALRQQVLRRLESPEEAWEPCPECETGWSRAGDQRESFGWCDTCYGLAVVVRSEAR